ncbi:MAG TPA: sigma factor-like helix-turn-helix DNA-binding protein [Solirubrobacterales bacterium]|nr:sigma factor-like helix-turn-helix DNA-binding protein [Solirubrobacterales bacterium]
MRGIGGKSAGNSLERVEKPQPLSLAKQAFCELDPAQLHEVLDPREQKVLRLKLGFEDGRRYKNSEIKIEMGVGDERVRQIESRAILKLAKALGMEVE